MGIAHPSPYGDTAATYRGWVGALDNGDFAAAQRARQDLRTTRPDLDWDYMTWQEWKEGLASYARTAFGRG